MNDSYERIQEVAEMEERRLKARITVRFEVMMGQHTRSDWFPDHLVALLPKGRNNGTLKKSNWAGVLNEINTQLESKNENVKSEMNAKFDDVNAKFKEVQAENKRLNAKFDAKFDEVNTKVDTILQLLQLLQGGSSRPNPRHTKSTEDEEEGGFGFSDE